jgi:hypothetical protein
MSLFRYFTAESGLAALATRELMVIPPKYLDDPFEASPRIRCFDPREFTRGQLDKIKQSPDWFNEHQAHFPGYTFEQFQAGIERHTELLTEKLVADVPSVDLHVQTRAQDIISERFGVICFTSNGVHPTMWARYASHQGLVIGFDEGHKLFSGRSFFKVEYSDTPYTFDASNPEACDDAELILRRKGLEWCDQCEMRLVLDLKYARERNTPQGLRYFLPIGPELITSVTVGLRISDDFKTKVIEALQTPGLSHVECYSIEKDVETGTLRRVK